MTIYVALPDEAVQVWRPVLAEELGEGRYRIVEQVYDLEVERWEFVPGDEVVCEHVRADGGEILAARRRASPNEAGTRMDRRTLSLEKQALLREVVLNICPTMPRS